MPAAIPVLAAAGVGGGLSAAAGAAGYTGAALFAAQIGAALTSAAAAYGASSALGLNRADNAIDNARIGATVNPAKADEPIPIAYGRVRLSGPLAYRNTIDKSNKRLFVACCWSEGEIDAIEEHYFDKRAVFEFLASEDADNLEYIESHLGSDDQAADAKMVEQVADWTDSHRLRGIAYSAFKLKYNNNGPNAFKTGFPVFSALIRGIKCFDPRTGETVWTQNPALILFDYLTNKRYGRGVPYSKMDEPSFIEAADYCDELVTYPSGNQYPRYQCNIVLDPQKTLRENVLAIASTCRGWPIYSGRGWSLHIEKPQDPHPLALTDDIMVGGLDTEFGAKANRYNRIRVTYNDSKRKYQPNQVVVKSSAMLDEDGGYKNEWPLYLPGTSTKRECRTIASAELKQSRQSKVIETRCTLRALEWSVGCVVAVYSELAGWSGKPFTITKMLLYSDDTVGLQAVEYDPSVYTLDVDDEDELPETDSPDPFSRPKPQNFTLAAATDELLIAGDGGIFSRVLATWDYNDAKAGAVAATKVRWKAALSSTWVTVETDEESIYLQPVADGNQYDAQARSVNFAGDVSSWTGVERIFVTGKTAKPSRPVGFRVAVEPDGRKQYFWNDAERDKDGAGWRIYYGTSNSLGSALRLHEGFVTDSPYLASLPYAGIWFFFLVQVDTSGNESDPRIVGPVDLSSVQVGNAVFQADARALGWPGVTDGIPSGGQLIADDPGTWDNLGATQWLDWDFWGVTPVASFVYTHTAIDLGSSQTVIPLAYADGSDNLTIETRNSANGSSWSGWGAVGGSVTNRYFEFRATVSTTSDPVPFLNSLMIIITE